jgi:hypothetical protein
MIMIIDTTKDTINDIKEKMGDFAIGDIIHNSNKDLYTVFLNPDFVKIAYDNESLHILRFEVNCEMHCIISNFRYGKVILS